VTAVMTADAKHFVGPATFAALTGRPVADRVFDDARYPLGAHIELARKAKLLVVAPATANFLAKAANGLADDLLSTLYLAFTGPILFAPTMNTEMWEKAAVQRNVQQLRADAVKFVELHQKASFPEAVRYLAQRAGLAVPESQGGPDERAAAAERDAPHRHCAPAAGTPSSPAPGRRSTDARCAAAR